MPVIRAGHLRDCSFVFPALRMATACHTPFHVLPHFRVQIPSLRLGWQFIGASGSGRCYPKISLLMQHYCCAIHGFLPSAMTYDSLFPSYPSACLAAVKSLSPVLRMISDAGSHQQQYHFPDMLTGSAICERTCFVVRDNCQGFCGADQ